MCEKVRMTCKRHPRVSGGAITLFSRLSLSHFWMWNGANTRKCSRVSGGKEALGTLGRVDAHLDSEFVKPLKISPPPLHDHDIIYDQIYGKDAQGERLFHLFAAVCLKSEFATSEHLLKTCEIQADWQDGNKKQNWCMFIIDPKIGCAIKGRPSFVYAAFFFLLTLL